MSLLGQFDNRSNLEHGHCHASECLEESFLCLLKVLTIESSCLRLHWRYLICIVSCAINGLVHWKRCFNQAVYLLPLLNLKETWLSGGAIEVLCTSGYVDHSTNLVLVTRRLFMAWIILTFMSLLTFFPKCFLWVFQKHCFLVKVKIACV